ncbi:SMI1/KNR4 family protein [Streptomyces sannanensis]|uniref:SMI1/KNR4 family protein n=1 Tax=Streptomyces sannanensis TaxID=285536 RepID=A0ABP6SE65_9ACTN
MNDIERLLHGVASVAPTTLAGRLTSLPAPASAEDVARAEAALGFALPPLLAGLYTRIADGGYGPEYGLFPLVDGKNRGPSAVARYLALRAQGEGDPDWGWPEGVLPISDWGCAMLACVDCRSENATVLLFEPNPGIADLAWYIDSPGLAEWLRGWLDGTAWFCEEDGETDLDMAPWPEFRARI